MMDYDDLVKRLRGPVKHPQQNFTWRLEAADAVETLRRERDEALAAQGYLYIGRDGKPILARDLEDQRDAALAMLHEAGEALEPFCDPAQPHTNNDYLRARAVLEKIKIKI